jgi:tetratricopeptide (TPR) repeat protein
MRFRAGLCARGAAALGAAVEPLRADDPRWVDTLLFEARRELVGSPQRGIDLYAAEALLDQAHAAFPTSPAIALAWANSNLALAEFDKALAGFDHVLAAAPTHRDAMLGRVTALSYALKHDEAIATATRMIDLGTWHMGDAYYWRAWNHYNLKAIEPAWADVEEAVKLLSNTGVYTLAGLIAYSRQQLPTAIERFDRAFEMDGSNCDAVWMASLSHVEQQAWPLATPKFSRSMSCYVSAAAGARNELAALETSDRPEPQKVRTRARLQRTIEVSDERGAQSAFNAAQGHLRQGNKGPALAHVDVAAAYAPLTEKAAALKAAIEKMP